MLSKINKLNTLVVLPPLAKHEHVEQTNKLNTLATLLPLARHEHVEQKLTS